MLSKRHKTKLQSSKVEYGGHSERANDSNTWGESYKVVKTKLSFLMKDSDTSISTPSRYNCDRKRAATEVYSSCNRRTAYNFLQNFRGNRISSLALKAGIKQTRNWLISANNTHSKVGIVLSDKSPDEPSSYLVTCWLDIICHRMLLIVKEARSMSTKQSSFRTA